MDRDQQKHSLHEIYKNLNNKSIASNHCPLEYGTIFVVLLRKSIYSNTFSFQKW